MVDRGWSLEVHVVRVIGDDVVARLGVVAHVVPDAPVDEAVWLQLVHEVGEALALRGGHALRRVVPDQADWAVAGHQLAHLRDDVILDVSIEVACGVVVVPVVAVASGVMPILRLAVVEAKEEAMTRARIREFADDVALERRRLGDGVVGDVRVPQAEAVVVLCGDDDVLLAGLGGEAHPCVGIEVNRVELGGEWCILGNGDALAMHDPLADAWHELTVPPAGRDGVEAPVDEEAEAGVAPPVEARIGLGAGALALAGADCRDRDRCSHAQVSLQAEHVMEMRIVVGRLTCAVMEEGDGRNGCAQAGTIRRIPRGWEAT